MEVRVYVQEHKLSPPFTEQQLSPPFTEQKLSPPFTEHKIDWIYEQTNIYVSFII
jgi:hypothetical protein